jgi:hypothetical protein
LHPHQSCMPRLVHHRPSADPPWMKIPDTGASQPIAKSIFFLVKVGWRAGDPEVRALASANTNIAAPFEVAWAGQVSEPRQREGVARLSRRHIPYRVLLSRWNRRGMAERATLNDITASGLIPLRQHIPDLVDFAKSTFTGTMPHTGTIGATPAPSLRSWSR